MGWLNGKDLARASVLAPAPAVPADSTAVIVPNNRDGNPLAPPGTSAMSAPVNRGPDPGSSGKNLLRLGRPSAAPLATEAPTPADYAIQPRSPVGRCGIGREYLGGLTMARSRLRACDI